MESIAVTLRTGRERTFTDPAEAFDFVTSNRAEATAAAVFAGVPGRSLSRSCARLCDIARDGQILVADSTMLGLSEHLPAGWRLTDLGAHRLRDLSPALRVYALEETGIVGDAPPPLSPDSVPNNLPTELSPFVGREAEIAALVGAMREQRLVTVVGPGGVGKTRLAGRTAAEVAHRWTQGVWWVDLSTTDDGQQLAGVVASAVGALLVDERDAVPSLVRQLGHRRLLLCLDNCEHLVGAVAELVAAVLRSCPEVSVLATSREPLGCPGELVWRAPVLSEDDAMTLFTDRARLVTTSAVEEGDSTEEVRLICARVDRIPLAVELAAGWSATLTPHQIMQGLDDRLALLVRSPRGVAARHRTLANSIGWSYSLLDEADRRLFRWLAVCRGSFTLGFVQAMCATFAGAADVREGLGRLVDKSLVFADHGGSLARFRLLESIRVFAEAQLNGAGETDAARGGHLDASLHFVESVAHLLDDDKDTWRALVEPEYDNLRAAIDWGLARNDTERGRRLVASLAWLWHLGGNGIEGIGYLQAALAKSPADRTALQGRLLTGLALVADTAKPLGLEYDAAQAGAEIAREAGDAKTYALAMALSAVGRFYTDFAEGRKLLAHARELGSAAGDAFVSYGADALTGIISYLEDDHEAALTTMRAAAQGLLEHGNRAVAATTLGFMASSALCTGHPADASALADQAVEAAEPLRDYHRVGWSRSVQALVAAFRGDLERAWTVLDPIVELVEASGTEVFVAGFARVVGTVHLLGDDPADAVSWFEREATSAGDDTYLTVQYLPCSAAALRAVGDEEAAAAACERGLALASRLGMPRYQADALEQQAYLRRGNDPTAAEKLHHEALALRLAHGLWPSCVDSLEALAELAATAESYQEAGRLLAAAASARVRLDYPRAAGSAVRVDQTRSAVREALGDEAFAELWEAGQRLELDDAVAYARRTRGVRGRPSRGWASLTPTELRVVRLAVDGRTNPQIGDELFMSRGTVKAHLSHVYAKLGVGNRTELAAAAARHLAGD